MLKILWFTPTPSLAENYLNSRSAGGGWIKSLESAIQGKVQLSIVFYSKEKIKPFTLDNGTTFYPIYTDKYKIINKILRKVLHKNTPLYRDEILTVINKVKPDLIHFHGSENPYGLIQNEIKIPSVLSIQGIITVYKEKYYSGISFWQTLVYSNLFEILFLKSFISSYTVFSKQAEVEKKILADTTNIIGRTVWDRRVASVLAPKANYFHNDEILRNVFYKVQWIHRKKEKISLLTTTGPNLYKGIETIIHCTKLLDTLGFNYKWKIAGINGKDKLIRLALKSKAFKLSKNLFFLGTKDDKEIVDLMQDSDLYVSASHIENSPNNICEALIVGLPVIASYAGGTCSLIDDGREGTLIQDGDPYSLAGAIIEASKNYNKLLEMAVLARERALCRHNPENIIADLIKIYETVIREQKIRGQFKQ